MQFHVSTSSREPIYRQLAGQIREAVARGQLSAGDKLPTVRELSEELVVNPNTIARTYRELERDGVLHTRQGKGVFIAKPDNELTKTARNKKLHELLDRLLTDAVYLGFSEEEVLAQMVERLGQFQFAQQE